MRCSLISSAAVLLREKSPRGGGYGKLLGPITVFSRSGYLLTTAHFQQQKKKVTAPALRFKLVRLSSGVFQNSVKIPSSLVTSWYVPHI